MEYLRVGILGLSQIEMAEACGISQSAVSRYELDSPDLRVSVLRNARAYAKTNGIDWPDDLTDVLVSEERFFIEEDGPVKPKVGRPARG